MERYKNCSYFVNKEKVKRRLQYMYGTIENFCIYAHFSKVRYWEIVNKPHFSKDAKCLQTLSRLLDLSIDEILM